MPHLGLGDLWALAGPKTILIEKSPILVPSNSAEDVSRAQSCVSPFVIYEKSIYSYHLAQQFDLALWQNQSYEAFSGVV